MGWLHTPAWVGIVTVSPAWWVLFLSSRHTPRCAAGAPLPVHEHARAHPSPAPPGVFCISVPPAQTLEPSWPLLIHILHLIHQQIL